MSQYLDFITETVYLAGRLTLGYFQTGVTTEWKTDRSPVSIADRQSELLIRQRIESVYPGHDIIGEEFGEKSDSSASHRWIIDPIDGTKSFIRGVPLYAVLIGLEIDGKVEAGAAYFPALDEMLSAATGLGCWWNGRRAHVSSVSRLGDAWITYTSIQSFEKHNRMEAFLRLMKRCFFQPGWSDAYGYLLVATGRAEVAIDPVMNVWDCGPFPPIFSEAGGYFGDWRGNPTIYAREALAVNSLLLPEVLSVLQQP